jgi:peptide deformylase
MFKKESTASSVNWEIIATGKVQESDMLELFLARVGAFGNLASTDSEVYEIAKKFLLNTMTQTEDEYDFPSKQNFLRSVSSFDSPVILVKRGDEDLCAIVYKINYRGGETSGTLHEISFFVKTQEGKYKYTHKFNLAHLYQQYCIDYQVETNIRQLGDCILHREARNVTSFESEGLIEIKSQVRVLKNMLTKTGGVGIAANQCSEVLDPLKIILSGVDYNEPEHVIKALTRYPTALFPPMRICINPEIIGIDAQSDDFAEGCLSVHGIFRGIVRRARTVSVRYQDVDGAVNECSLAGTDARVMLHELDHILNGKVYIQRIIEELSKTQCEQLGEMIRTILSSGVSIATVNPFLTPMLIFERNSEGQIIFDADKVRNCFVGSRRDVLQSICKILAERIISLPVSDNTFT